MNAAKGLRFRHKMKPEKLLSREFNASAMNSYSAALP